MKITGNKDNCFFSFTDNFNILSFNNLFELFDKLKLSDDIDFKNIVFTFGINLAISKHKKVLMRLIR